MEALFIAVCFMHLTIAPAPREYGKNVLQQRISTQKYRVDNKNKIKILENQGNSLFGYYIWLTCYICGVSHNLSTQFAIYHTRPT